MNPVGDGTPRDCDQQNVTRLARDLKYADIPPTPATLDAAGLPWACGRLGLNPDATAAALTAAFGGIVTDAQHNDLRTAMQMADGDGRRFPPDAGKENRRKVAALVYWLGRLRPKLDYYAVPVVPIAAWLGIRDYRTVSTILRELVRAKVIELRPGWSYTKKQAREARYIGPDPVTAVAVVVPETAGRDAA